MKTFFTAIAFAAALAGCGPSGEGGAVETDAPEAALDLAALDICALVPLEAVSAAVGVPMEQGSAEWLSGIVKSRRCSWISVEQPGVEETAGLSLTLAAWDSPERLQAAIEEGVVMGAPVGAAGIEGALWAPPILNAPYGAVQLSVRIDPMAELAEADQLQRSADIAKLAMAGLD